MFQGTTSYVSQTFGLIFEYSQKMINPTFSYAKIHGEFKSGIKIAKLALFLKRFCGYGEKYRNNYPRHCIF